MDINENICFYVNTWQILRFLFQEFMPTSQMIFESWHIIAQNNIEIHKQIIFSHNIVLFQSKCPKTKYLAPKLFACMVDFKAVLVIFYAQVL